MFWSLIFALASLFIVIYNAITVIAIIRKRTAPSYFKVKFSLILDVIWCLALCWLAIDTKIGNYDLTWLFIYLCLMLWYAFILKDKSTIRKSN